MVGAGAMVINKDNKILVVREKYYKKPHWKLPGGYVDPGMIDLVSKLIRDVSKTLIDQVKVYQQQLDEKSWKKLELRLSLYQCYHFATYNPEKTVEVLAAQICIS